MAAVSAARNIPIALPLCPGCRERDARIADLEKQLAALQTQNRKLGERVRRNASNSSMPPSTNPPDAPKPSAKKPTGRKPGGQPGHKGHTRVRLPRERVQHVIPFVPLTCEHCQAALPEQPGPNDPAPTWHHTPNFLKLPPSSPNTKDTHAPVPIVAKSPAPPSPTSCVVMSSAHTWAPPSVTSAAVLTSANAASRKSAKPCSRCRSPKLTRGGRS